MKYVSPLAQRGFEFWSWSEISWHFFKLDSYGKCAAGIIWYLLKISIIINRIECFRIHREIAVVYFFKYLMVLVYHKTIFKSIVL